MILWLLLTILTAVVAVIVAIPIIRRIDAPKSDQDRILQVSRDQLAEIDADIARGAMTEAEGAEARNEVERRVLAAARRAPAPLKPTTEKSRIWAIAILGGWIVAGTAGLYAIVGHPDLPSQPALTAMPTVAAPVAAEVATASAATAMADATGGKVVNSVEEAITSLKDRLAKDPKDAEGWRMLGWSYFNTERFAESSAAYAKAVELDGSLPDVWSAYGETLVRSARGMVSDEAIAAFDAALKLNPADPRARFFKGMALEQAGDANGAIEAWLKLAESAPPGADWLAGVVTRIDELAAATNFDLKGRLDPYRAAVAAMASASDMPSGGLPAGAGMATNGAPVLATPDAANPGPTAADVAAAGELSPEDRQAMILGMLEKLHTRLMENPDDPAGWVKLIKSRLVMNDAAGAEAAYTEAKAALAAMPDKLSIVTEGARAAGIATE